MRVGIQDSVQMVHGIASNYQEKRKGQPVLKGQCAQEETLGGIASQITNKRGDEQ